MQEELAFNYIEKIKIS